MKIPVPLGGPATIDPVSDLHPHVTFHQNLSLVWRLVVTVSLSKSVSPDKKDISFLSFIALWFSSLDYFSPILIATTLNAKEKAKNEILAGFSFSIFSWFLFWCTPKDNKDKRHWLACFSFLLSITGPFCKRWPTPALLSRPPPGPTGVLWDPTGNPCPVPSKCSKWWPSGEWPSSRPRWTKWWASCGTTWKRFWSGIPSSQN